jgi:hypothetical protein
LVYPPDVTYPRLSTIRRNGLSAGFAFPPDMSDPPELLIRRFAYPPDMSDPPDWSIRRM